MTELRCLYEGTVTEEEIDHLGHMNVHFYATKARSATDALAAEYGLGADACAERGVLLAIPDSIEGDDVALLEPLGVGLHAIDLAHFRAGESAAVFGAGPIGLFIIRALKAAGASRIIATDARPHRVEAALASGADEAYLTEIDGLPEGIKEWEPVDASFEAAGEDMALEAANIAVRRGGRVVVVGIPPTNRHAFTARYARSKGLTMSFSRRMKAQHMLRAIELADNGTVSLDGIITSTYPLSEAAKGFDELVARSGLKIVVKPTD